ncbi:hypothetical protein [Pseudonocardia sp. N23]|uniref:hypothetical protein n=1 Tax=Pseudonocardia sp. N23 TaxID=1987376 RepID=UPI000C0330AB|nr:hypothetical protein [Pseudonocardia sp. N23]GAY09743.1 hypothetical protein TOK_4096 [Pseudonocardia sp. N23]
MNPTTPATDVPPPWQPGRARRIAAGLVMLLVLAFSVGAVASMPEGGAVAGPAAVVGSP